MASPDNEQLILVPFHRGQGSETTTALYYPFSDVSQKWSLVVSSKAALLSDVLKSMNSQGTLYNPQFLQGVGLFHGSYFCTFELPAKTTAQCTSLFTDEKWAFLKKFKAGPPELDLVFDGGVAMDLLISLRERNL